MKKLTVTREGYALQDLTTEEIQERELQGLVSEKEALIESYKEELNLLDLKSIRAIRSNDVVHIGLLETKATEFRNLIKKLEIELKDVKQRG